MAAINKIEGSQLTNFIPAVWSKKILDRLKEETKLVDNCWQEYEGEVKHTASVHILGIGNVVINEYTGTVDYDQMEALALEHKPKLIIGGASAYS